MLAVTSIMRAQAIVLARVDAVLRPLGLSFARYELLQLLSFTRAGSLPMTRAGALLQVHPASVTNAATAAGGGRARAPAPPRRPTAGSVLVAITEQGRAVAAKATDELNAGVFRRPGLSPDSVATLVDVLRELRADAGDFG